MLNNKPSFGSFTVSLSPRFFTVLKFNFVVIAIGLLMCVNAFATTHYIIGAVNNVNSTAGAPHNYVIGATVCAENGGVDVACDNVNTYGIYTLALTGGLSYRVHVSKAYETPQSAGGAYITSADPTVICCGGPLTGYLGWAADVSGNFVVNSYDAGLVTNWLGAHTAYGSTGKWRFTPVEEGCPWPYGDVSIDRYYIQLGSSYYDEDFNAILIGEVTGDWISQ